MSPNIMLAFVTALIASCVLTPLCRRLAPALGFVDKPNARKLHLAPMPLLGGLAIYVASVLAILFFAGDFLSELWGIVAGATLVMAVGLLDDRGLLHHQIKLMLAMPVAAVLVLLSGVHLNLFSEWFGEGFVSLLADNVLAVIWIVGITASFSIFDHMDGLCAGIAAIAAAFFVILSGIDGQLVQGIIAAAVFGAALGFLRWNFKPAKLFMGDSGAMFLGFMMAVLGLMVRIPGQSALNDLVIAVLVLGVAVFDTLLVIVSRTRRGLVPFASPGKDHTAHRLANLGLGQRNAVIVLYLFGLIFGGLAILVSGWFPPASYAVIGAIAVGVVVAILTLERVPYERQEKTQELQQPNESAPVTIGQ